MRKAPGRGVSYTRRLRACVRGRYDGRRLGICTRYLRTAHSGIQAIRPAYSHGARPAGRGARSACTVPDADVRGSSRGLDGRALRAYGTDARTLQTSGPPIIIRSASSGTSQHQKSPSRTTYPPAGTSHRARGTAQPNADHEYGYLTRGTRRRMCFLGTAPASVRSDRGPARRRLRRLAQTNVPR